ncbi:MAG: hypothetical protein HQL39_11620 [Alphaproteobacteria bacterium]|nr:hypothetical protein [Alphaproteobacteria bacterium]
MTSYELFIAGQCANSVVALHNLQEVLDRLPPGAVELTVTDVLSEPLKALDAGVLITPALLCRDHGKTRMLVGSMATRERLVAWLKSGSPTMNDDGV